jgi:hypothetical protein
LWQNCIPKRVVVNIFIFLTVDMPDIRWMLKITHNLLHPA